MYTIHCWRCIRDEVPKPVSNMSYVAQPLTYMVSGIWRDSMHEHIEELKAIWFIDADTFPLTVMSNIIVLWGGAMCFSLCVLRGTQGNVPL